MNVQVRLNRSRAAARHARRSAPDRRQLTHSEADRQEASRLDAEARLRRAREAAQPQDEALYRCRCGFVFRAQVSTSVRCPHCDSAQAW